MRQVTWQDTSNREIDPDDLSNDAVFVLIDGRRVGSFWRIDYSLRANGGSWNWYIGFYDTKLPELRIDSAWPTKMMTRAEALYALRESLAKYV